MKFVFLSLAVLAASVTAWPQTKQTDVDLKTQRVIDDILVALIEALSQLIKDRNLDPYYLESAEATYVLPDADFFSATGSAQSVALNGLSDIRVRHVSYNILSGDLSFDIVLPHLAGSVGAAAGEVRFFTRTVSGEGSGSLDLWNVNLYGKFSVHIDFSGVTVDPTHLALKVAQIDSNIYLNLFGRDVSDSLNNFLGNTLVAALETHEEPISGLLVLIAQRLIDRLL